MFLLLILLFIFCTVIASDANTININNLDYSFRDTSKLSFQGDDDFASVYWTKNKTHIRFGVVASVHDNGYAAVGFNTEGQMVGTKAVVVTPSSLRWYDLKGMSPDDVIPGKDPLESNHEYSNSQAKFFFSVPIGDLGLEGDSTYFVFASGSCTPDGGIVRHDHASKSKITFK